jgi:hypothetical protein
MDRDVNLRIDVPVPHPLALWSGIIIGHNRSETVNI